MADDNTIVKQILARLGPDPVDAKTLKKLSNERARNKLSHRITTGQKPNTPYTDDERALLGRLGLNPDTNLAAQDPNGELADVPADPASVEKPVKKTPKAKPARVVKDKPVKPAAKKKAPAKEKSGKGDARLGARTFEKIVADGKEHKKDDVVEKLVAAGIKEATARSYCTWAKRKGKHGQPRDGLNPFTFTLIERKDEKTGVKFVKTA